MFICKYVSILKKNFIIPFAAHLNSREIGRMCMKLQNPPRVHSLKYLQFRKLNNTKNKQKLSKLQTSVVKHNNEIDKVPHFILSATSFSEVCHWRKFSINSLTYKCTYVVMPVSSKASKYIDEVFNNT